MKGKKLICLALATFGFAALFTACGKTEQTEHRGDDTTQQGSQGGEEQSGEGQGGSQSERENQDKNDKEEQQKPGQSETKPGSGSENQGGSDKEEQEKPGTGTETPGSGSENQGSQGEQSGNQGEGSSSEEGQGGGKTPEKHEHSYTYHTTKNATCLEDGEEEGVCSCGETTKRTITRLGHSYGEVQTDSKGQFQICTRCGHRDDIGETIEFTVNIVIEEGSDFQIDEKTQILVYKDSSVYKIYDAQEKTTFSLLRGKYIVRVDGFSDMYIQKGYYELSESVPSVDIVVGNNPEYDRQITGLVHEGDKMFNFLVKDTQKEPEEYQRFYDIAKGKKLIFIDFFYVACNPCEYMLNEELEFYRTLDQTTKDQFLMILIDKVNQDTAENINEHRKRMGIPDEIITMQRGAQAYKNFENWGTVPHGGFLDENLTLIEITSGWNFKDMIEKHLQGKSAEKAAFATAPIPEGEEPRKWLKRGEI